MLSWKKLIVVGGSNTQYGFGNGCEGNWLSSLANQLQRRCDVINRGFSGYNSRFIKDLMPRILKEFEVDSICCVILQLGTNDSSANELQHVPFDEFKQNLRKIIEIVLNYGVNRGNLILITPPKIDDEKWSETCKSMGNEASHHDRLVKECANICLDVSEEMDLKCVDLNGVMNKSADYSKYLHDGLHLSHEGGKLLFKSLKPIIDDMFIEGDSLKINFPLWKDLKNSEDISNIPQFCA